MNFDFLESFFLFPNLSVEKLWLKIMAMPAAGGDIRTVVRNIFDSDDKQLKTYTEFGKVYNM